MKGLALTIAIALTCIWTNTNGMQVNVNVGINNSDEQGLKARSNNAKCIDTTCTKSGKKCLSIPSPPDTLPQKTREEIKANNPDQKFDEEEYQALKSNITLGCSSGSNSRSSDWICVCLDTEKANQLEAQLEASPGRAHPVCADLCTPWEYIFFSAAYCAGKAIICAG